MPQRKRLETISTSHIMEPDSHVLEKLYSWVDQIPLSRPKKNMGRDFADAGLYKLVFQALFFFICWVESFEFVCVSLELFFSRYPWGSTHLPAWILLPTNMSSLLLAVMAAEIINFMDPRIIHVSEYVPSTSLGQKIANWQIFNRWYRFIKLANNRFLIGV